MTVSRPEVCTVLDIGARHGLHRRWQGLPVHGIGVDADAEECARLNARLDARMRFLPYALSGADAETRTLYITAKPGCSSLLEPNISVLAGYPAGWAFKVLNRLTVTTTSLDTMCAKEQIAPHVLKVDTQGTELEILRGGLQTLSGVLAVELEVDFLELYKGQPLFRDIDLFMASQGFSLLSLRRDLWRRRENAGAPGGGQLAHGDALYIHEPRLSASPEIAAIIWLAYKQYDRLDPARTPRPSWIARLASALMRRTPHRVWRARLDRLCPTEVIDWHDPEEFF